jgi:hypothetical protein
VPGEDDSYSRLQSGPPVRATFSVLPVLVWTGVYMMRKLFMLITSHRNSPPVYMMRCRFLDALVDTVADAPSTMRDGVEQVAMRCGWC